MVVMGKGKGRIGGENKEEMVKVGGEGRRGKRGGERREGGGNRGGGKIRREGREEKKEERRRRKERRERRGKKKAKERRGEELRVGFWNVVGVRGKDDEFWERIKEWDVMGLVETWIEKGK